jgi:transposase, IS6 family
MLTDRRDAGAAYRFLQSNQDDEPVSAVLDHDRRARRLSRGDLAFEAGAIRVASRGTADLQKPHNMIETDHGALKRVIRPTRRFQSTKAARATLKKFKVIEPPSRWAPSATLIREQKQASP